MTDAMNVAAAVQSAYGHIELSWEKLHKLLYFCQAWSLVWDGVPLFGDRIEAWKKGPVVREVYRVQKHYPLAPRGDAKALNQREQAVVEKVVAFYGHYRAHELIALTHREVPWRDARIGLGPEENGRNEVTRDALISYFGKFKTKSHEIPETVSRVNDLLLTVPEEAADTLADDASIDFDAELAYLRGQGPDPWGRNRNRRLGQGGT